MINEDYCSYEVAKLFKEKGFDYQGFDYIDFEGEVIRQDRPTLQMAMAWLRENGIIIEILHVTSKPVNDGWFYSYQKNNDSETNLIEYPAYEQAVEAALKYCLENLI